MNLRYLAYCKAEGFLSPESALARDRGRYPGGHMAGFIVWISGKWREWRKVHRVDREAPLTLEQQQSFVDWLTERKSPNS